VIKFEQARGVAQAYVDALSLETCGAFDILDQRTQHLDVGYVFFCGFRAADQSLAPGDALLGNVPLLVSREDGQLFELGSAHPVENYIEAFRATGDPFATHR
jgi:hypothetical protein